MLCRTYVPTRCCKYKRNSDTWDEDYVSLNSRRSRVNPLSLVADAIDNPDNKPNVVAEAKQQTK